MITKKIKITNQTESYHLYPYRCDLQTSGLLLVEWSGPLMSYLKIHFDFKSNSYKKKMYLKCIISKLKKQSYYENTCVTCILIQCID